MPRSKPSQVITHRIELGDFERTRLEGLLAAVTFGTVSKPIIEVIKDNTAMLTIGAFLLLYFPNWIKSNLTGEDYTAEDVEERDTQGLADYVESQNLAAIAATGTLAYFTGGLSVVPAIIVGIVGGTVIAEGAEEVVYEAQDAYVAAKKQVQFLLMLARYGLLPSRGGGERGRPATVE